MACDPAWFRQVLAQYPTGVCLVTSVDEAGAPFGMTVGSFTSVSLDPPLVAFLPQRKSGTHARIRAAGRFCVNILSTDQESVCRTFASQTEDRFATIDYRLSPSGLPVIRHCLAWIECRIERIVEAGDHDIVIGLVADLDAETNGLPLLFYQGGYGHFASIAVTAQDPLGQLTRQLRAVDSARPTMERLASALGARCIASVRADEDIVIAASAGAPLEGGTVSFVGQRLPFLPPSGSLFAAWLPEREREAWLMRTPSELRDAGRASLALAAERGYSLGLAGDAQRAFAAVLAVGSPSAPIDLRALMQRLSYEPASLTDEMSREVRLIAVPVGEQGEPPALVLTLYDFPNPSSHYVLERMIDAMKSAAADATAALGTHRAAS